MKDRSEIQREAVMKWKKANKKGTLEMATGTGKTIAALGCLYTMPRDKSKVHIFLAETTQRESDLDSDILKFNELYGVDVRKDYNLVFKCYQGVYDLEGYDLGLVISDEIHNALTPVYSKFFYNNNYDAIVGLSATVERGTQYTLDDGSIITKGDYLDDIAPVCFKYSMKKAIEDNIGRVLDIYLVELTLNNKDKTILAGSKQKPFYQTEQSKYDYLNKTYKQSFYCNVKDESERQIIIRNRWKWRSEFLYRLSSRINETKLVIDNIPGKSVLFGNELNSLLSVTPNVVSSKKTTDENIKLRDDFDNDRIKTIGSFKMLRQGANLKNVDNCVLMSFYGLETHIVQQAGRLRVNGDKKGAIVIFYYKNTFEEDNLSKVLSFIKYDKLHKFNNSQSLISFIYEQKGKD